MRGNFKDANPVALIFRSLIDISNHMPPHLTPLAYKYVMVVAMIAFINHYAPRLNMPFDFPLKEQDIQRLGVDIPECDNVMIVMAAEFRFQTMRSALAIVLSIAGFLPLPCILG